MFRMALVSVHWPQNDQQSGEHISGGLSAAMHAELHYVSGLRLMQLPSFWQDVWAQHSWHSAHCQLGWHRRRQRLGMVEQRVHTSCLMALSDMLLRCFTIARVLCCIVCICHHKWGVISCFGRQVCVASLFFSAFSLRWYNCINGRRKCNILDRIFIE